MPGHPMISVPVAVAGTGRTKAVVNEALLQLETAGVVTRASQGQRNRIWEAAGLLDLLADLESSVSLPESVTTGESDSPSVMTQNG